ncbi:MAG: hypothetical protein J1E02_07265 [Coprobacter sp.]|nr:hypothetical protein [Coprobacter sp.]
MDLKIEQNIPDFKGKTALLQFATSLSEGNFEKINELLSEEASLIRYDKEKIIGKQNIVAYFKDWTERFGLEFSISVQWIPLHCQAAVILSSEIGNLIIFLYQKDNIIKSLIITPLSFGVMGLPNLFDELPYSLEFIKTNAKKPIDSLKLHLFCRWCGKPSEDLIWRKGIIFRKKDNIRIGTGFNISYCPDCNHMVEISPDLSWKRFLTINKEQEKRLFEHNKIFSSLTEEKICNDLKTFGNSMPKNRCLLHSKTNELGLSGKRFKNLLKKEIVPKENPNLIFEFLDFLKLNDTIELKIHTLSMREYEENDIIGF